MKLARVDANIWEASSELKTPGLHMDHRMTVVRLSSGELIVHSPVQHSPELHESILELGVPAWFIAPSRFHDLYWPGWFHAFPKARFAAAPGVKEDHPEYSFSDVLSERREFWADEFVPLPLRGMPRLNEFAFFHSPSRTMILADLIFNIDADAQGFLGRLLLRVNRIYRKPGVSRIFRALVRDQTAFRESLAEIASYQFDRTIIGHGANLGGRDDFRRIIIEALPAVPVTGAATEPFQSRATR